MEMTTPDWELLERTVDAIDKKDFLTSALLSDGCDDWNLVRQLGEFFVRLTPEDLVGHVLLVRSHRHLGNQGAALSELKHCQSVIAEGHLMPSESELYVPLLAEEQRLLG